MKRVITGLLQLKGFPSSVSKDNDLGTWNFYKDIKSENTHTNSGKYPVKYIEKQTNAAYEKNAKNLRASQATYTHTLSNEKVLQTCIYMKDFAGHSHGHHHLLGQLNTHTPSVFKMQVVAQTPHPSCWFMFA